MLMSMTKPHAAWIIQRARNAGWTLTAIAAELGVSRRAVYNWLDGEGNVSGAVEKQLERLSAKLGRGER